MITRTTAYTIDLDRPTVEDRWDAPLTYGDKSANIIQATLMRGAVAATLSNATVMLYGVLSDGTTAFRAGTVSGNVVTCELDYTFYAVPGKMDLLVQLSEGTAVTNTPLRITAHVKTGQTGELVSTGEQFSLAALQAIIAGCETATENAGNAADSIDNMTVAASPVSPGGAPTAAVSDAEGHKHVLFGIPSGLKGDTGASITGAAFDGDDIVLTKDDSTTVTLEDAVPTLTGPQGVKGDAGVMVYSGTAITGTSTTPTTYATGITLAYVGDRYHYNGTVDAQRGNVYKCTLGGDADTALWVYDGNIRGVAGSGSVSTVNGISPDGNGDVALEAEDIQTTGGTVQGDLDAKATGSTTTCTLPTSGWSGTGPYTYAATATGVTSNNLVLAGPAPASKSAYEACGAYPSAQGAGTLTFTAESMPTEAITVNVAVFNL